MTKVKLVKLPNNIALLIGGLSIFTSAYVFIFTIWCITNNVDPEYIIHQYILLILSPFVGYMSFPLYYNLKLRYHKGIHLNIRKNQSDVYNAFEKICNDNNFELKKVKYDFTTLDYILFTRETLNYTYEIVNHKVDVYFMKPKKSTTNMFLKWTDEKGKSIVYDLYEVIKEKV